MAIRQTTPRIARVPHTEKRPERCPHCGSAHLARKGTRRKKIEIVQLWRCASCKRAFTPAPEGLRNKTYPLRIVLDAITLYNLGYSLSETGEKMKSRRGHRVGRSTIALWLAEHRTLTTYARLRAHGRRLFRPTQVVRSLKLYHRQVYKFAYHRGSSRCCAQAGNTRVLPHWPTSSSGCPRSVRTNCSRAANALRRRRLPPSAPSGLS